MASKNPQDMMAAVTTSMQERTGKTLEEWVEAVQASGIDPLDQKAVRNWLKTEHQVPQNSQWAIADAAAQAAGWQRPSNENYTDSQYAGEKAALRPIFDRLRQLAEACGQDVVMEGRGGYTPFVHNRQFMAVEASSKIKVTLGLRFKTAPTSPLLEEGKAPGQCTHRIILTDAEQVSPEIGLLIKAAYEQN
ncbi:MAG TPA: DUF5655 domain-containing protein [Anaerolineaceae bacterium]|nr:DUF5655 domain-containing protein [Anaerolineaceae bacterium]